MTVFGKIVIATDKFKGSMTAAQASEAIRDGIVQGYLDSGAAQPEILLRPMADGGEGSMGVMERALRESGRDYRKVFIPSVNHLGSGIQAPVLLYRDEDGTVSAFIEMASVCGLNMVHREKRNLLRSTTYGLGVTIRSAIEDYSARKILLAIGGSGTNDGGFGMLTALGWSFSNQNPFRNKDIPTFISGIDSASDRSVADICPHLRQTAITVASDVSSPLLGPDGATSVYGPQKGCRKQDIPLFEHAMQNWVKVLGVPDFPGAGAAGGTGYALKAALGAEITQGWKVFSSMLHLEEEIASADLAITGEGRFDMSSLTGKLPSGIADICRKHSKPLWIVTGRCRVPSGITAGMGISRIIEISSSGIRDKDPFTDAPNIIRTELAAAISTETEEAGIR